jgi:hypothetical protein
MPELWETWCDRDNPVLRQLTTEERLKIEQELDGTSRFNQCMKRPHLVKEILERRNGKGDVVYLSCRREDGGCDYWASKAEFKPLNAEELAGMNSG